MGVLKAAEGGDAATAFKDSTNSSAVKRGQMILKRGGVEQNLAKSLSLSAAGKSCDLSTQQTMDLNASNYRWHNEDVNETFVDPSFNGFKLQSATLCIKYNDVDFTSASAYTPELDVVQFGKTTLAVLPGNNGETRTECWDVKSRLQQNTSANIPFIVNVDAAQDYPFWAVYLYEARLSTCHVSKGTIIPCPPCY